MFKSVDGKVGAIHAAEVATATFIRGYDVGRMIALGVEGRGKGEDSRGTELNTEPAPFASFDSYRYKALGHWEPPVRFFIRLWRRSAR
jgi:hypothetical protein